jgi:hypothetical protein
MRAGEGDHSSASHDSQPHRVGAPVVKGERSESEGHERSGCPSPCGDATLQMARRQQPSAEAPSTTVTVVATRWLSADLSDVDFSIRIAVARGPGPRRPEKKERRLTRTSAPACGTVRYRTKLDAKIVLARTQQSKLPQRQEVRAYRCPQCRGWNLTSRRLSRGEAG